MKKLSKTMQAALDEMKAADWYYQHNGKGCGYFATETGVRNIGHESTAIVEGDYVYATISSSTLAALGKRGVVEVVHDGKRWLDAVKVVGMVLPERLTKALIVKIVRRWTDRPTWSPQEFTGYAVNEAAVHHLAEYFTQGASVAEVTVAGEVDLEVWDFLKDK